tara:strand:+ start:60 stop:287 length:228 start_codon:yes stop_codon:yes gene_type:complete
MTKVKISKSRHLLKALTWSILASFTTFCIGKALGLDNNKALMIVVIDRILKFIFYYLHERAWFATNFGVNKHQKN